MESVLIATSDGLGLPGDLLLRAPGGPASGGVVVCHPHPQYGGDRFNPVVDALFRHLPTVGLTTLRFDFRRPLGGGDTERHDVVAALDELDRRVDGPLHLAGYSFGAAVALSTRDPRVGSVVAVAPPLAMVPVRAPAVPCLVLVPEHDQFTPPEAALAATSTWDDVDVRTIPSVDHSLLGRARDVATTAGDWLVDPR